MPLFWKSVFALSFVLQSVVGFALVRPHPRASYRIASSKSSSDNIAAWQAGEEFNAATTYPLPLSASIETHRDESSPSLAKTTINTTSAVAVAAEAGSLQPPNAWTLWRRRLITHEDPFSVHKLSAILYTASSVLILGTGAQRFLTSPPDFAEIPSSLELPVWTFVITNTIMCSASVRMAFLHRKFDLAARNAFLGTAASSLFSGFYLLWTSPFAPNAFNNQVINRSCFGVLVLLNVIFIMDTLLNVPDIVEGRRDRKADDYEGRYIVDVLGYVLPVGWGLLPVVGTGIIGSVLHDRQWFFEQCVYIDQMTGQPGLNASIVYLQVMTSLAASYASLFVTLRDKKLIGKQQELAGITVFSVPTMIWTIYVSVIFLQHLFDFH